VDLEIAHFVFAHGRGFRMTINVKFNLNQSQIKQDIVKDIRNTIYKYIPVIQKSINVQLEDIIFKRLFSGVPNIVGRDRAEIGVPDINERLQSIIRVASQSFEVSVKKGNILFIELRIIQDDYSDLLSLPEAVFSYISVNGSGVLDWLRWLLLEGTNPIVIGFDFTPTASRFSRTGDGLMRPLNSSWSVPNNIAGTANDNMITRALVNIEKDIEILIKQELTRIIK